MRNNERKAKLTATKPEYESLSAYAAAVTKLMSALFMLSLSNVECWYEMMQRTSLKRGVSCLSHIQHSKQEPVEFLLNTDMRYPCLLRHDVRSKFDEDES